MGELTFQIDLLRVAIGSAKKYNGTPYQRFLFVTGKLGIIEKQYIQRRHYTQAMWTRHLLSKVRLVGNCQQVLEQLMFHVEQPPTSNTGVNPVEQPSLPLFSVEYPND